jgi:hypothetical protein
LAEWRRDWANGGLNDPCVFNSLADPNAPSGMGGWSDGCPSTNMVKGQRSEGSGVLYDDYASENRLSSPGQFALPAGVQVANARNMIDRRDDNFPRMPVNEIVVVGSGGNFAQKSAIIKWKNPTKADPNAPHASDHDTGWDYNLDGLRHVGLMPDFWQDVRNIGVTWELLTPEFNAAEDFIEMWENACAMAKTTNPNACADCAACSAGQTCGSDGQCHSPPMCNANMCPTPSCTAVTCAGGCCNPEGQCIAVSAMTKMQCGIADSNCNMIGGGPCQDCTQYAALAFCSGGMCHAPVSGANGSVSSGCH